MSHHRRTNACTGYRQSQRPRPCGPDPCGPKPGLLWPKGIRSPFWTNCRIKDRLQYKSDPYAPACPTYKSALKKADLLCPVDEQGKRVEGFSLRLDKVQCGDCTAPDTPTRLRIGATDPAIVEILLQVDIPVGEEEGVAFEFGPIVQGEDFILSVQDLRIWNDPIGVRRIIVTVSDGDEEETFLYKGPCLDGRAITYTFTLDSAAKCPEPKPHQRPV